MAEEWGSVVLKAPKELLRELKKVQNGDASNVVKQLSELAEIDHSEFAQDDCRIGNVYLKSTYAAFEYFCSDWRKISETFINKGNNIEIYARTEDEYGAAEFYALSEGGDRFSLSFDHGGDAFEIEGYEEEITAELNKWVSKLPNDLKKAFPSFADIDGIDFDGP